MTGTIESASAQRTSHVPGETGSIRRMRLIP